jgi:predicted glutamine amidotransferase
MCKLFIAAGKFSREQVLRMIAEANNVFALTQRDGFGFTAYGPKGVAYGRYLNPESYCGFGVKMPPFINTTQIEEGEIPPVVTALVIHGRTSTNKVIVDNCHPFRSNGIHLAHNGVLRWVGEGPGPKAKNGCDTEEFFQWWLHRKTNNKWSATNKHWSGYGVFGIIDSNTKRLIVAKCGSGNLNWVCDGKDNHLFSTTGHDAMQIGRAAGIKLATKSVSMMPKTVAEFSLGGSRASLILNEKWCGFADSIRDTAWDRSMGIRTSRDAYMSRRYGRQTDMWDDNLAPREAVNPSKAISVPRDTQRESFPDFDPDIEAQVEAHLNGDLNK